MVFQDNSDFASVGDNSTDGLDAGAGRRYPGVEDVKRGEEFITAGVSRGFLGTQQCA